LGSQELNHILFEIIT